MRDRQTNEDARMERLATAAAWRVRLTDAGLESSADFEAWLAEDAANEAAWRQVAEPWDLLGEHATDPRIMAARRRALAQTPPAQKRRIPRRARAWSAAAAAVIALLTAWFVLTRPTEYRTAMGERRVLTLADGSTVSLDSGTVVQTRYSEDARELRLLKGQARFDVAHDARRPFSVDVGDRKVIATGTSFNIDLRPSRFVVTLIEGHVLVTSAAQPISLTPGQALSAPTGTPSAPPHIESVSVNTATSWQSGRLMFDNETLQSAAERVGRYADKPLLIADEQAAQLRLSGVFNAGDVATFIDTVSRYLPVEAQTRPDGTIVLSSLAAKK